MSTVVALIVWTAMLFGLVEGLKAAGRLAGIYDRPWFGRLLPVTPFVLGGFTGVWILPAVAAQVGLAELATLPAGVYAVLGIGAGAVAGQAYKIIRQTLAGDDWRILGRRS